MEVLTRKLRESQNLESREDHGVTFIYQNCPQWGVERSPLKVMLEETGHFYTPKLQITLEFQIPCVRPFIPIFKVKISLTVPWSSKASDSDTDACSLWHQHTFQFTLTPWDLGWREPVGALPKESSSCPFSVASYPLPPGGSWWDRSPVLWQRKCSCFLLIPSLSSQIPKPWWYTGVAATSTADHHQTYRSLTSARQCQ